MLVKHIRRTKTEISPRKKVVMKRTQRIGTLIAFKDIYNVVRFGWSLLNQVEGDKFNNQTGIEEAKKRASPIYLDRNNQVVYDGYKLPVKIRLELPDFFTRVKKYFK